MNNSILKSILKSIFSIKDYKEIRTIITFLGIKITYLKPKYREAYKNSPYFIATKNKIDIKQCPKATGILRDIQLAQTSLLKKFDDICQSNDIKYWLDYGTLLGAIRHKGFIPWDDDIDVGMMRNDYKKLINVLKNDKNLYVYLSNSIGAVPKVMSKKSSKIFIDIFPYDYYGIILSTEEQILRTKKIHKDRKKLLSNLKKNINKDILEKEYDKILRNLLIDSNKTESDIVCVLESVEGDKNIIKSQSEVFPLKKCVFENMEFSGVNNPDAYLRALYGNYLEYPKRISTGHYNVTNFTEREIKEIKAMVEDISLDD